VSARTNRQVHGDPPKAARYPRVNGVNKMKDDKHSSYIALTRLPEFLGYMMNVQVMVDGKKIGEVPNGSRKVFSVEPGMHEVYVKVEMNYHRSSRISVPIHSNEIVEFNCSHCFKGIKSIYNLFVPTSLIVQKGAVKLENIDEPERRGLKLSLLTLLPILLNPVILFVMAVIFLVLWLSKGLVKTIFGNYADLVLLLLGTIGVTFFVILLGFIFGNG
jgi:hypothetical protein